LSKREKGLKPYLVTDSKKKIHHTLREKNWLQTSKKKRFGYGKREARMATVGRGSAWQV